MSNLLRNDHNVYILGAGFSREAGLPLISDFLSQMRDAYDWLAQQGREREATAVDAVLKFRLAAASAAYWVNLDLENIEELFSLAFSNTDGITKSMRLAIAATLDFAVKSKGPLRSRLDVRSSNGLFQNNKWPNWLIRSKNQPENSRGAYEIGTYALHVALLLGMLRDGAPQGENTFITFNYDTLLEDALIELKLPMTYGSMIGPHPAARRLPSGSTLPDTQKQPVIVGNKKVTEPIPVFKMHGSVNWSQNYGQENKLEIFENYDALSNSALMPELVPPTWKKVFQNHIESVWEAAIEKLNTASRIIIIGFSMPPTDMHFKYLLAAGLKQNISLRQVVLVNPDANDELKQRVEKMLRQAYVESGRITFVKQGLGKFTGVHFQDEIGLRKLGRATEDELSYEQRTLT